MVFKIIVCDIMIPTAILLACIIPGILALSSSKPASTESQSHASEIIRVYDNVLPKKSCDILHAEASRSGLGHKVFSRPLVRGDIATGSSSSIIEQALDSILSEIGDETDESNPQYVEYWTRQEWRHIEAHADVDEFSAKEYDAALAKGEIDIDSDSDSDLFRYPNNGHVLYLKVGTNVRGPTCVFPKVRSGGELLQPHSHSSVKEDSGVDTMKNGVDLITVPAVEGRVLRFEGSSLHSVPRPADLWFLSFVRGAPNYTPEEEWGRSVILFNTWTKEPPKAVPFVDSDDDIDMLDVNFVNERASWDDAFSLRNGDNDIHKSENVCDATDSDSSKNVKIWLLGNERRRDHTMRTIKMKGKESMRDAFLDSHRVSHMTLEQ